MLLPLPAHAAEDDCKLTRQQKTAAVKAFRQLYPIYQDERCLNCHGAMNPFSPNTDHPGGWVNIRKAARELLMNANLPADLVSMDDTSRAAELQALSEIASSDKNRDVENAITDNDVIRMQLHFSFTEEAEEAEWTCTGPGYSNTDTLNVDVYGMLKTLNMPVASGSVGEASERGVKAIESITITVVDSPVGQ